MKRYEKIKYNNHHQVSSSQVPTSSLCRGDPDLLRSVATFLQLLQDVAPSPHMSPGTASGTDGHWRVPAWEASGLSWSACIIMYRHEALCHGLSCLSLAEKDSSWLPFVFRIPVLTVLTRECWRNIRPKILKIPSLVLEGSSQFLKPGASIPYCPCCQRNPCQSWPTLPVRK